jgi:hypothetical protein
MKVIQIIGILVLSILLTYGLAILDLLINSTKRIVGVPFGFETFGFPSGNTNNFMLVLDVIFWFFIISGIWWYIRSKKKLK